VEFERDPKKAALNLARHGVSFQEATTVFDDLLSITVPDPDHSVEEDRFIIVGPVASWAAADCVTYGAR